MVHPFRSASLVIAALSASSVAPAQVRPASEPLLPSGTSEVPSLIVPATIATPELPAAEPTPVDPLAPEVGTDEVRPNGDLASTVAELRSTQAGSREMECLAGAIYFESKSESLKGQLAVGHVIANRTKSGKYPTTYCGVVYQRGQFSFVRGGSMPSINRGGQQWKNAVAIARIVDDELHPSPVGKALSFHARRVSPGWRMTRVATLGNHVFYR